MIDYALGGEFLNVTCSKGAIPHYSTYGSGNTPMIGIVSYDPSNQSLKVYDGGSWHPIGGGSATINLSGNAISILKWAEQKMFEEQTNLKLAETNPTIKSLMDEMHKYKNQIEMVKILMKDEVKV